MTENKGNHFIIDEPTMIELEITDVALIFHDSGQMSLFIPKMDDEDSVPSNVVYLTMLGALLANEDKDLLDLIDKKLEESVEKVKEDKEN